MADVKFTDLTALGANVAATDILAVTVTPGSTPTSKSATAAQVVFGGLGITAITGTGKNFLDLADPSAITFPKITAANDVVAESAATYRASLGATTLGSNLFTAATPGSTSWLKINTLGGVTSEDAATTKTSLSLNNVTNDAQIKASDFPGSVTSGQFCVFNGGTGKVVQAGTGTGLVLATSGVYSVVTDNRTNWDTAFTNNLRWDGGATSLVAATGRTSLGIGDAKVYVNSSAAAAQTGFSTDQYLTGSTVTLPAGAWATGGQYRCMCDMGKTAAGTATPIVTVRLGTAGTTSDTTGTLTLTFLAPSAAGAETVTLEVFVTFRSVGSGTSAVVVGVARAIKNVLSTAGFSSIQNCAPNVSSGFNSTTPTKIGVSFNGGTSFSGTCQMVQAEYKQ